MGHIDSLETRRELALVSFPALSRFPSRGLALRALAALSLGGASRRLTRNAHAENRDSPCLLLPLAMVMVTIL
jgi:hypothetical protein